jgi:Pvc16 N-terminal domain
MALLDIGAVTRALMKVVDLTVNASPGWPHPPAAVLTVSPLPPDKLTGDPVAGLYLYHVTEDPAYKNVPSPPGVTDLRYTPMALNLYYVLSAKSGDTDAGTLTEQLIMGLAVKALRDMPVIDDSTLIGGTQVLDPAIRGEDNRFRIILQPMPAAEAVSYWTAGSSPLRLSAYYQVNVALLESPAPPQRAGRVLSYGIQTFTTGAPRLEASESTVTYRLPAETTDRTAVVRPAQVTQLGPGDTFTLLGTGLAGGTPVLLIRPRAATAALTADAGWQLQVTSQGATARAQATASGSAVPPGLYGASIVIDRTITLPDKRTRIISQPSNEVALMIAPGISALGAPDGQGQFSITGGGFTPPVAVEVFLGAARADAAANPASLAPAQFAVSSATTMVARLPTGIPSGSTVPVRVVVSGSEAPPAWVIAP